MINSIQIENLSKSYKKVKALQDLNLTVEKGGFYGLIGPDGAGKTTLMRILTSLLIPDSGKVIVEGLDPIKDYRKLRVKLGYMPGRFSLYQDLSVEENLKFFARVFGTTIEDNYHLIEPIYEQIKPFKNRRAGKLSGGMKQKLALSCALVHKPELLILDEPTTGVDAVSRREFWDMLKEIRSHGITIVVSTPYMEEAVLCDKISLMFDGDIVDSGSAEQITDRFPYKIFAVESADIAALLKVVRKMDNIRSVNSFGQCLHVVPKDEKLGVTEINSFLNDEKFENYFVREISPGIEDCFINYIMDK